MVWGKPGGVKDAPRILVMGAGKDLVESAGVPATLPSGKPDPGLIRLENGQLDAGMAQFIAAIAKHRHFARETDPPAV